MKLSLNFTRPHAITYTNCRQLVNRFIINCSQFFSNVIFIFVGIALKPDVIEIEMFTKDNPNLITIKVHWRFRVACLEYKVRYLFVAIEGETSSEVNV